MVNSRWMDTNDPQVEAHTNTDETSLSLTSGMSAGTLFAALHGEAGSLGVPKPFADPILLVEDSHVAGTSHVPKMRELTEGLSEGDRLRFERDQANRYDRWAIRVFDGHGRRLGYVPTDNNQVLARLMDGGKHLYALVTGVEQRGTWTRIGMDVYLDD